MDDRRLVLMCRGHEACSMNWVNNVFSAVRADLGIEERGARISDRKPCDPRAVTLPCLLDSSQANHQ